MNKIISSYCLLFLMISSQMVVSQNEIEAKEKILKSVKALYSYVSNKDLEQFEPFVSDNIKVSGYDGKEGKNILNSFPLQVKVPTSYEVENIVFENDQWSFTLKTQYDDERLIRVITQIC